MSDFEVHEDEPVEPVRPRTLSLLCILTFIWSGWITVGSVATPLLEKTTRELLAKAPESDKEQVEFMLKVYEGGWKYFVFCALLSAFSFVGAILMWKLRKNGFHLYAVSNLLLLFVPGLFFASPANFIEIGITTLFIAMYAVHLKFMH